MKLTRARVTNYKSIDDSGWVTIDNVTCMVGKNESGKTAFLQSLQKLNPIPGVKARFDLKDYPRKGYVRYKRSHNDNPAVVVQAEFELSDDEIAEIEAEFGPGVLRSRLVVASMNYKNQRSWDVEINESATVRYILADAELPVEIQQHVEQAQTREDLMARLESLDVKPSTVQTLLEDIPLRFKGDIKQRVTSEYLEKTLPRFVYFDNYSAMRGRISIQDLRQRRDTNGQLDDSDRTFLSLLTLVGADLEDLENETNYEYLKAELESASIGISDEIFEFWQQNNQLRVEFDLSHADPKDPAPLNSGTILHVRIWNNRHRVSVPFDERSKGFVWFFSFLSYFSILEEIEESDLILLLDEPGLNLHAMAQHDFLRFIRERLAPKHQVIYTTHSPFMIDLDALSSVRTVQDTDAAGTVVSDDVFNNDPDTVYPLQVALGYKMAQTLFLAPHCLMVNGASDLIYLQVLSEIAASHRRTRLDPRWVVIPVGGTENLPTFVSLLGDNYVSTAVLMDVTPTHKQRIEDLNRNGSNHRGNPIKWVEVTRVRDSDIEDLFEPDFYLRLVNEAYASDLPHELTMRSITDANPRIQARISAYFENEGIAGGHFDPYRPAAHLLEHHARLRAEINESTIDRVASMFDRINALLISDSTPGGIVDIATAHALAAAP